jgi:hypothetical protein
MSLARLKDALDRAVTRRLVTVNVAQHVTIPRRARREERKKKEEVKPWYVSLSKMTTGIGMGRSVAGLLPVPPDMVSPLSQEYL